MVEFEIRILDELLSSGSSDDDDDLVINIYNAQLRREIPRIRTYIRDVVDLYDERQFKNHFRVSRGTCNLLIHLFEESVHCSKGPPFGGMKPKNMEEHILLFLWFVSNKTVYRAVAELFGASISTPCVMIQNVMNFLTDDLGPVVVRFPTTLGEKEAIAEEFQQISGFPSVCGCIDSTFINIRTPARKLRSTYTNRHDATVLSMQGICDAKLKFLDVFTGISGKIHDARTFPLSFISNKIPQLGENFHVLGDAAYPLSLNVLTPYRNYGNFTDDQIQYNRRFCATRVKIENAFGLLKQRFRQLIRTDMWSIVKTSKLIISCCVLHNLCIEREDFLEEAQPLIEFDVEPQEFHKNDENRRLGERKRDALSRQFNE